MVLSISKNINTVKDVAVCSVTLQYRVRSMYSRDLATGSAFAIAALKRANPPGRKAVCQLGLGQTTPSPSAGGFSPDLPRHGAVDGLTGRARLSSLAIPHTPSRLTV